MTVCCLAWLVMLSTWCNSIKEIKSSIACFNAFLTQQLERNCFYLVIGKERSLMSSAHRRLFIFFIPFVFPLSPVSFSFPSQLPSLSRDVVLTLVLVGFYCHLRTGEKSQKSAYLFSSSLSEEFQSVTWKFEDIQSLILLSQCCATYTGSPSCPLNGKFDAIFVYLL